MSLIITAYNEDAAIGAKIENSLMLDYPADLLEVIVASDGSTDRTDEIVATYGDPRVRLVANPRQEGKTLTTNLAVDRACGAVLVFSDATGMYSPGALRVLCEALEDPAIGAVSGRVVYSYEDSATARGFGLYQRWVVAQRIAEPRIHTATSVSGSIHAVRRELFRPVAPELSYDMVVPAMMAMQGRRTAYAPGARSREVSRVDAVQEFTARVRIAVLAYTFTRWLVAHRHEIPDRAYLCQLFFHKILRWFSWPLLLALLFAHTGIAIHHGGPMAWLLIPHIGAYLLAILGFLAERRRIRLPGLSTLLLFMTVQAAYATGFMRWISGGRAVLWTPDREAEQRMR